LHPPAATVMATTITTTASSDLDGVRCTPD
jgi:hypothetical protein